MKVKFDPPSRIFEDTPLEVEITFEGLVNSESLKMNVSSLGKVPLQCKKSRCHGYFKIPIKGIYQIRIDGDEVWEKTVTIEAEERISLMEELGIFLPLLGIVLTGVILWAKKRLRSKI